MPETLASGSKTVFHYHANVTPPKDYKKWASLIKKLISHWIERYGLDEVSHWFFEVWNEPNLKAFGTGKQKDYFKLYRHTVAAIKSIDASLKVGGPATAQNAWIAEFLTFCEKNDLAADRSAPTIIRPMPSVKSAPTPLRNLPMRRVTSCKSARRRRTPTRAGFRFITRSGTFPRIRATRSIMSHSPPLWLRTSS